MCLVIEVPPLTYLRCFLLCSNYVLHWQKHIHTFGPLDDRLILWRKRMRVCLSCSGLSLPECVSLAVHIHIKSWASFPCLFTGPAADCKFLYMQQLNRTIISPVWLDFKPAALGWLIHLGTLLQQSRFSHLRPEYSFRQVIYLIYQRSSGKSILRQTTHVDKHCCCIFHCLMSKLWLSKRYKCSKFSSKRKKIGKTRVY